ncbi:hypothetical protein JKF63_00857 [Porcisia hertigi]|uniref:Uncharacterized protein n=1 Tax=Porcisia hertigi TaxID=2761500 RepID=A0A836I900_9TRYP|nr:hypothetical protein JKF63_00857 [Porcisia hertigi]
MAFLTTAQLLAGASRLPLILLSSPPLRQSSSLFESDAQQILKPGAILRQLRDSVPCVSKKRNDSAPMSYSKQKEIKRRGFNAIIRWCAYHQDGEKINLVNPANPMDDIDDMNVGVLRWVQESADSFSCGQCLVLLSFLAEVLDRQRHRWSANGSAEPPSSDLIRGLCRCISLLMARSVSSEQLEIQPFLILLSAAYALDRVTHDNPLKLPSEILETLSSPPALWFALVHQVNLHCSASADVQSSMLESTTIEALLTTLLLFDPARCQQFLATHHQHLMAKVAKLLDALITPPLRASRQDRESTSDTEVLANACLSAVVPPPSASAKGAEGCASAPCTADSPLRYHVTGTSSVRIGDFARILLNARSAPPTCRAHLMEYLLCVLRHPSTFTVEEMRCLPAILAAVRSRSLCRSSSVPDYILTCSSTMEFHVLVEILSYAKRRSQYRERIYQLLRHRFQQSDGAEDMPQRKLEPHIALSLLLSLGLQLPWTLCRLVLLCSLAIVPELLGKIQAAKGEDGDKAAAVQNAKQPISLKVPLTLDLCAILYFLEKYRQSSKQLHHVEEAVPNAEAEIPVMLRTLVSAIDWKGCTEKNISESTRGKGNFITTSVAVISALSAYVDSRITHQSIPADDAMDEQVLLKVLVLPVLRDWRDPRIGAVSLPILAKTAGILTKEETKRRLVTHMIRLAGEGHFQNFFAFVRFVAPLAIECKAATPEHTAFVFSQRTLGMRLSADPALRHANALKVHTTTLIRTVRYLLAIGALDSDNASVSTARRETVRLWFEHYLQCLAAAENSGKESALATENVAEAAALPQASAAREVENSTKERQTSTEEDSARAVDDISQDDVEDGDDAADEQKANVDDASIVPEADFMTSVTDEEVEEVLSLMLQVGCKQPYRVMLAVARRMADRTSMMAESDAASVWCTPASGTTVDRKAKVNSQTVSWDEHPMNSNPVAAMDGKQPCSLVFDGPPLAAHFVCAVRIDSSIALPALLPTFLKALLTSCDIRIFQHVLSAYFMAVKRRRPVPFLAEDLQIGAIAFSTLHDRIVVGHIKDNRERSATVFKSIASFLHHLTLAVPHLRVPQLTFLLNNNSGGDDKASASERRGALAQDHAELEEGDEGADETDEDDGKSAVRAELETHLLRLIPYLQPAELKQLGLSHLQRLSLFFPHVAPFVAQQLQPQLCDFSQRELLLLVAQYPAGVEEVLASLSKTDIYATVDLNEFITIAKKLPMKITEAVVAAHLPHMTIAWVTRVLSALAARHEEVSLPLLRSLLDRVSAAAENASESDKSLLMMILQGYLLFRTERPTLVDLLTARKSAATENSLSNVDDILWEMKATGYIVGESEQHERRELIRTCCDRLLSLELISTLEALRFFLISYPPSLHQMREQGVVAKVEQKLLPDMLAATPVQWRDLAALVQLLAEHRVFLPSTVAIIFQSVFTEPHLASIYKAVAATSDSDTISALEALLQVAAKCAEVTEPGSPLFPLLSVTELVLSVFNTVQHWLAAVTKLLSTSGTSSLSAMGEAAIRHVCRMLLYRSGDLKPSEFAGLVQSISRLRAWDLMLIESQATRPVGNSTNAVPVMGKCDSFDKVLSSSFERADAHSRCVLLKAIAMDTSVLRRFETILFPLIESDVPLLSPEDLELVLTAALQASSEAIVEPVLDAIDTRMLPMLDQCRRSAIVRLVQCHAHFSIDDKIVVTAALQALERQATAEVKLDIPQLLSVLQAVASLTVSQLPERLVVLCFQRLEKMVSMLTPLQQYQVGRLILDLEMGYSNSVSALVLHILDSRDGARGHAQFQAMTEELCDVFEVELPAQLRASRLRKVKSQQRVKDFWSAQRKVKQEALLYRCQC